ncbi:MAG: transposase [Thermoproteus sp.]|nr:transposase [Thermoproteus sp.]
MLTYSLKCDTAKAREALGGEYNVVDLGTAVRIVESMVALYRGEMPICMYKSWRLTYADLSPLDLSKAEALVKGDRVVVRLVRGDEKIGLRELAEGRPLIIHAMDVNEGGVVYRVFRLGGYTELVARGVASSISEAFVPKKGVNIAVVDLPLMDRFKRELAEVLKLSREHYVELHTTMLSDVCPLCGERMVKRGRLVYCPRCKIRINRDVNAAWTLARNILRRLGRFEQLAELRETFMLTYPDV